MTRWHPLRDCIPTARDPGSALRVATIRYGDYPSTALTLFLKMADEPVCVRRTGRRAGKQPEEPACPVGAQVNPVPEKYG